MSTPDYNDPRSKLRLRLRPVRGSGLALKALSVFMLIPAVLSFVIVFAVFLLPNVPASGNPLWGIVFGAVFLAASRMFYAAGKWFERLERI